MSKDYQAINRTIMYYYLDRNRELKRLMYEYKQCCCIMRRRKIRQRKEELLTILKEENMLVKHNLQAKLGIRYKKIKNYPHLINIEMKSRELKRELL